MADGSIGYRDFFISRAGRDSAFAIWVGKLIAAQEYAWRNRGRYHGVWWIRAEKSETLLDDLIELGARFIPGLKEVPDRAQAAQAALDHIADLRAEKPWLLVYDNVEQPGDIEKLTPVEGAHVLITTRWSDWSKAASPVKIGVFPPDVAEQFLLDSTERTDREGAEKLAAALGFLPLALDHASAYCRRTGIGFNTYLELAANLIRKVPKGADYEDEKPVFATLELAIQKATEACPEAEKLMGICAFLAPERIPLDIITTDVMSEIERGEAVAALQEVSLVALEALDDGSGGISVHRLVQEVMRGRLRETAPEVATLAIKLVAARFPGADRYPGDVRNWPACARLLSHALAVLDHASHASLALQEQAVLSSHVAIYAEGRADYVTSHRLKSAVLPLYEKLFGSEHPETAAALNNLAVVLEEGFGRFADSEKLKRRALAIDEKNFGPEHPTVAIHLNNLALLLKTTNRLAEAEPLYRRALAIDEKSFGPGDPSVGRDLNNLAQLLKDTNRLTEAEQLMRRALKIDEASFGPDHPNVGRDLNNLALLLQDTNRLAEAEPLMRRALEIDEASFGPDHPNVGRDLNNLALLLQDTNRLAEAEPLMRRALKIDEASFGPDHRNVGRGLNNLALLLQATNRLADAEPLMRRALAIAEASFGLDHPTTQLYGRNLESLEAALRGETEAASVKPNGPVSAAPPEAAKPGLLRRLFGGGS